MRNELPKNPPDATGSGRCEWGWRTSERSLLEEEAKFNPDALAGLICSAEPGQDNPFVPLRPSFNLPLSNPQSS